VNHNLLTLQMTYAHKAAQIYKKMLKRLYLYIKIGSTYI